MPKRISIETYGLTEEDVIKTTFPDFLQIVKVKRLSPKQIAKLKSYRRLLKVRDYGKEFRRRAKNSISRMKDDKIGLELEATRLRKEIEWYENQNSILETLELLDQFI